MHKTCSKEFWKTVWSNDHNALNILAETIETKPKHTPFAIKIKSRAEKKKTFKGDAKQYSRVLETQGNDLNATMEGPKQRHTAHHKQLTAQRAKRSHNSETAG